MASQQRLQAFTAQAEKAKGTLNLPDRSGHVLTASAVNSSVHVPIVAELPPSTEVHLVPIQPSTTVHCLDVGSSVRRALAMAGLNQKQACAYMALDESQFGRQLKGEDAHVSLQRLLRLPVAFWVHFLPMLGEPMNIAVTHEDLADVALKQAAVAFEALARGISQMRRRVA